MHDSSGEAASRAPDGQGLPGLAGLLASADETSGLLLDALPLGIVRCHADGRISAVNPAAGGMLGIVPERLTRWPSDLARLAVHDDGSPYRRDELPVAVALRTREVVAGAVAGLPRGPAEELRWLRITAVPCAPDVAGRPQVVIALLTDITGRRRADAAADQLRRLLGMLGEAGVVGIAEVTQDGVQQASDAYVRITGRSGGDPGAGPRPWPAISPAPPASDAQTGGAFGQLRRTGSCGPYLQEHAGPDGTRVQVLVGASVTGWHPLRWVTFAVELSSPDGSAHGGPGRGAAPAGREQAARRARERLVFLQQIRERTSDLARTAEGRRALETELRQGKRMQAVGQLTSGIAHDFGNLLGAISGYTELARDVGGDQDPQLGRILAEIRETADRAVQLTRDLLRFGSRRAEPTAVDLNALVNDVQGLLGVSVSGRAGLVLKLSPAPLPLVFADPLQLEQVLLNLVVNAREAMPEGGTVTIGTAAADLGRDAAGRYPAARPGRFVELTVQDTGVGMSAGVRARCFERQFTTKTTAGGAGLGLATVHGIITEAGGTIEVDSQEGRGSTFRVYLPAMGSERRGRPPAPRRPEPPRAHRTA